MCIISPPRTTRAVLGVWTRVAATVPSTEAASHDSRQRHTSCAFNKLIARCDSEKEASWKLPGPELAHERIDEQCRKVLESIAAPRRTRDLNERARTREHKP